MSSGSDVRLTSGRSTIERLLKRDRALVLAGIAVLAVLAWTYVLAGAGLGMDAWDMTVLAAFPHRLAGGIVGHMPGMDMSGMTMLPAGWAPAGWALMIAMWWVMMIAMMMPGAAPTILLYAQAHRRASPPGENVQGALAPIGVFVTGYLTIWLAFAIAATMLHWALERAGLVSPALMGSQSRWLSAAVLIAAGIYQMSPLKRVCLAHCRAPADFLARHWHPGASGALRLGALHGAYCVGCCWMLMTLLFVGGVMNVVWIATLAILVLSEKTLVSGAWLGRGAGIVLIAWGSATLLA